MTHPITVLARAEIRALKPYSSARMEATVQTIGLDANENPFVSDSKKLFNRYPDPQPEDLVMNFSKRYHINPEQLLITRGSDEAIDLLLRVFCQAKQEAIITCPPTYSMYEISAAIQGAFHIEVPLVKEKDFALDSTRILEKWQPAVKIIFLCSPNNPTGNLLKKSAILELCEKLQDHCLIVVDEAYIEFSLQKSLVEYLNKYPNLIILRTLSKAYGLAGVRCGLVLAHADIIALLKKVIAPYPIPTPVIDTIREYLTSFYQVKMIEQVQILNQEREELKKFLSSLPKIKKIWPSSTNYLLLEVDDAKAWVAYCLHHGIAIRDRSNLLGLENCIRISIGTPAENAQLKKVLSHV